MGEIPTEDTGENEPSAEDVVAETPAPIRLIRAPDVLRDQVEPLFSSPSVRLIKSRVVESLEAASISVEEARTEATRLVEEARSEAESIREEAREHGHATGIEEVLEYVARARREYDEAVTSAEDDMLEMAFRLAQRIVGRAIELEPEVVREMVSAVLRHARGKRDIVVFVSTDDLEVLESSERQLAREVDGVAVHFEADGSLDRGSCVIKTESGRIDGRIETQLQTLQRALRGG